MRFDRPGCFGFASTFNKRSQVCQECSVATGCENAALSALHTISELVNIDSVIKLMHTAKAAERKKVVVVKDPIPEVFQKRLSRMSAHAVKIAEPMARSLINYRKILLEKRNPLDSGKPVIICVLFDLLLHGPVTRQGYIDALQTVLGHSDSTAASQASIGFSVVVGLGIAHQLEDGVIQIRGDK
jgi:hypothetical protein